MGKANVDSLFGSKTRVKLLHLFLNNPERAFYVREISRKVDEQINSVRRELANLVDIDIIKGDSSNNRLYYEVNQASPFYTPLHQMFTDATFTTDATLPEKSDWTRKLRNLGDTRVVIFAGKLVHGSTSDVDLLVAGDVSKIKLKNLVKALEKEEGSQLTYTTMSYEDFYYRMSVRDQFLNDILRAKHTVVIDTENVLGEGTGEKSRNADVEKPTAKKSEKTEKSEKGK